MKILMSQVRLGIRENEKDWMSGICECLFTSLRVVQYLINP